MTLQLKPRVALLIHQLWPAHVPVWEAVQNGVGEFVVFSSVLKEFNRLWVPDFGSLKVVVQKSITIASKWRHPLGFSDDNYIHFPLDTYAKLSGYGPDVIVSTQLGFRTLIAAAYRALHPKSRLVVYVQMTEHQQRAAGFLRRTLRKILLKRADWLIANGSSALRVMTALGFPESRITIVPTVCRLDDFLQLEPRTDWGQVRRLVYVGRLVEGKGLLPFLEALNQVVSDSSKLRVEMNFVGYGPLEEQLAMYQVCDRLEVLLRGRVGHSGRHEAYGYGQVFVFPTLSDEWGLVVNEAMASGLPIFGSIYSQAVTELVEPGRNGWLFDPADRQSTVQALEVMLMESPERVSAMSRSARATISQVTPGYAGNRVLATIASVTEMPATTPELAAVGEQTATVAASEAVQTVRKGIGATM